MLNYDVVVIGGGPAGLAAAIEAKRNGIDSILIIERDKELGGILQQCIHNGFGLHIFEEELTGPEYAARFIDELKNANIEYKLNTMVLDITREREIQAINSTEGFMSIKASAIILAMGCRERAKGAITIPGFRPAGVFTAGTAQRFINIEGYKVGSNVVILGSGDIGLIMARRLTLEGAKIQAVVELLPYSGGLRRNIVQCLEDFNIPLLLNHTVTKVYGKHRVEGVDICRVNENRKPIQETKKHFQCDTLLLSVGLIPENELSEKVGINIDKGTSGPMVNESMETNIEGIFACGNVVHVHDLVDYVTEESRRAGKGAARFVKKELKKEGNFIKTVSEKGIKYIIPQIIREDNLEENLNLFMRVDNVYKDCKLVIKNEDKIIKEIKRPYVAPGEMERIVLKAGDIKGKEIMALSIEIRKD